MLWILKSDRVTLLNLFSCNRIGLDSVLRFGLLSVGLEVTPLVLLPSIGPGKMVPTPLLWLREEVS